MGEIAVMNAVNRMHFGPENERRQFKRFPMRLVIQARRDDAAGSAGQPSQGRPPQTVTFEIVDFSLGGMRGTCPEALERDERVTLFIPPFGVRPQVDITARVARCHRTEDRFDVGVEFCQTREGPEASPWLRIPGIFYMAGETQEDLQ